jgi:site-specific DNA-methyltransferase (adenine-specific)
MSKKKAAKKKVAKKKPPKKKAAKKTVLKTHKPTFKITCGDCIKGMRQQAVNPKLIFADPPFNIGEPYDKCNDKKPLDAYYEWSHKWLSEAYDLLHRHGTFWLAINDEHVSELDVMAKGLGFHKRSHVIWYYTFGVSCQKNFARSHTQLLYYTKTKSKFTWHGDDVRVPSARQLVYNDKRANPKGKLPDNTWVLAPEDLEKAFAYPEGKQLDTWLASRVCGTFHERVPGAVNQMPQKIMQRIIAATSDPGDLVLDPFLGTGSTGVAALTLDRFFYGFDISKAYCERARKRLHEVEIPAARNL